jgi:hypothetical protein
VVLAVDVQAGGVADDGIRLLGCLEGGIDAALGSGDTDEPRFAIGRGKRQKIVRVDGDLRPSCVR